MIIEHNDKIKRDSCRTQTECGCHADVDGVAVGASEPSEMNPLKKILNRQQYIKAKPAEPC